jgi:hypothetical protein
MALTKEKTVDFLSSLEGYHQELKMLHWGADKHSKHILTDEVDGEVLSFEDEIAEMAMGFLGEKITEGLKALLPENKELSGLLNELINDVVKFENDMTEDENRGIVSVCDDFIGKLNKYKYLETQS